jgi:hypothetical protein
MLWNVIPPDVNESPLKPSVSASKFAYCAAAPVAHAATVPHRRNTRIEFIAILPCSPPSAGEYACRGRRVAEAAMREEKCRSFRSDIPLAA